MNKIISSTKSFNSIISHLSSQGSHHEVLRVFSSMLRNGAPTDTFTFPSLLKACTSMGLFSLGLSLHHRVLLSGFSLDAYIAASLISFYAKFGLTSAARKVFDGMPERDVVHWTAVIGCYCCDDDVNAACCLFNEMRSHGVEPSPVTFLNLLSGVSELTHLETLHCSVILLGFDSDTALVNSMLTAYGKCGSAEVARDLFESMHERDILSWNSLILCYAQKGNMEEAMQLLLKMRLEGLEPDQRTFGSLVIAAAEESGFGLGRAVHGQILRMGFGVDAHLGTLLIAMYLKFHKTEPASRILETVKDKDVVLWTAMISGLLQNDFADMALLVFCKMLRSGVKPSSAVITSALAACADLRSLLIGKSIHGYILRQVRTLDIQGQNSLITMYAKCGNLEQSYAVFEGMVERDLVSWNALISGYGRNGYLNKALFLFNQMRISLQKPDSFTILTLLQACALAGALHQGKWIHNFLVRSCIQSCFSVETALVDMYCKCGDLNSAEICFRRMHQQDIISWSTIILGYGSHGRGQIALNLYYEFLRLGMKPNSVVFLSVLSACNHNGLVNRGLTIFKSMSEDHGVEPDVEHCSCIVDLLCRAGKTEEAYNFYKQNFSEPVLDVLGIILNACRANNNVELGDIIAQAVLMLKPKDAGNYVQLVQCYASMNRWDKVGAAWNQMRSLGLRKVPSWSFIELNGTITKFFTGQNTNTVSEQIILVMSVLNSEMRKLGINSITIQEDIEAVELPSRFIGNGKIPLPEGVIGPLI